MSNVNWLSFFSHCWYEDLHYNWMYKLPCILSVFANLFFLCWIVFVLVSKFHADISDRASLVKTARAIGKPNFSRQIKVIVKLQHIHEILPQKIWHRYRQKKIGLTLDCVSCHTIPFFHVRIWCPKTSCHLAYAKSFGKFECSENASWQNYRVSKIGNKILCTVNAFLKPFSSSNKSTKNCFYFQLFWFLYLVCIILSQHSSLIVKAIPNSPSKWFPHWPFPFK